MNSMIYPDNDLEPLQTLDISCLDVGTMHASPAGAAEDIITVSINPNAAPAAPGYITSTTIDWNSMHLTSSFGHVRTSNTLDLCGDDADIRINGVSLTETLQGIQDRLEILRPNPKLESRWQQLRDLREQYQALEQELQEKEQAWAALQQQG